MSKFEKFVIKSGNNQFGDNNIQNNITNNTINNKVRESTDSSGAVFGFIAGTAGLIWLFFNNIDQVYYYLKVLILFSFLFSIGSCIILLLTTGVTKTDIIRVISSTVLAISLYGLALITRTHAPDEIVQLAHQTSSFMDFWKQLTDIGKKVVVTNFMSAILIGNAALLALFGSFRQFAYSIANSNRTGWWYNIYHSMSHFNMRFTVVIVITLSGAVWGVLNNKIPLPF
ncbi:hypothetical protein R4529_05885 [Acinetobacter baumannii]|nr:hypothetical protein [Acinetobacter baumannii]MDV7495689.1 hypothetical protein [Acinetobacter baumannii]